MIIIHLNSCTQYFYILILLPLFFVRKTDCDFQTKLDYTREPNKFKTILIPDINCITFSAKAFKNFTKVTYILLSKLQPKTVLLKIFYISYCVVIKTP